MANAQAGGWGSRKWDESPGGGGDGGQSEDICKKPTINSIFFPDSASSMGNFTPSRH